MLVFKKDIKENKPKGCIAVNVNESSVTVLIDGAVYLFEIEFRDITLDYYHYRRRRV